LLRADKTAGAIVLDTEILAYCRQGASEINWNLCPSRVATHDQRDDHCTEPTVDELQPDAQFDCGKAPQCAFVERLSTSRGGSAIGCCPVASLLACWAAP
jgi:hypothetical protein